MNDGEVAVLTPPASDKDYLDERKHPMLALQDAENSKRPKTRGRGITLSEAMPELASQ